MKSKAETWLNENGFEISLYSMYPGRYTLVHKKYNLNLASYLGSRENAEQFLLTSVQEGMVAYFLKETGKRIFTEEFQNDTNQKGETR